MAKVTFIAILAFLGILFVRTPLVSNHPAFAEEDAGKLRCISTSFWADEPNNTPGHYYLYDNIQSAKPSQKVVFALSAKNNGSQTATNIKATFTFGGNTKIKLVDARSSCSWDETNAKLTCNMQNMVPGGKQSAAGRLKINSGNAPGKILTVDAKMTSANYPISNCAQSTLTIN